jgi:hypothetical protein
MVLPTVQNFVNACIYLNGFSGKPPEVIFGDKRDLVADRVDSDIK